MALQEIVVTGIRGSLERALQIKRMSLGVVDAISAEQIGQFPDSSIGQAIGRIPGVTVNRGSVNLQVAGGPPTSTGDVTGVTIRGFGDQFNELLVEGRPIASGLGQNFDFGALGSNWVGEVAVHKTPDFSLSSGDIGGTINVKFPNPFDHPGLQARATVSATDFANDGGIRPAFGALVSDTFDNGKFGILVDGDYTDHHVQTHHLDIVGWKGTYLNCGQFASMPTGCSSAGQTSPIPSWYIQDMAMYLERTDERRKDGRVSLQWRPNDAVLVTVDDNYSSDDVHTDRFQFSTWFNSGSMSNVMQDANGTITNFTYGPAPTDFNAVVSDTYITTNTPGLNVQWFVNDDWTAELDADESVSKLNPNHDFTDIDMDTGYGSSVGGINTYTGGVHVSESGNTLPFWTAYGPGAVAAPGATSPTGSSNFFGTNPFIIGSHVLPIQEQINTDKIKQVKLDATWQKDSTKVHFGFQYVEDSFDGEELDTFTNNEWQLWSGYGPASNNSGGVALPSSMFSSVSISNFIPGYSGNGNLPPGVQMYNPYTVVNYLVNQPINSNWTGSNGYTYTGGFPTPVLSPGSVTHIVRKNYAPFVTAEHNFDVGGMTLKADAGLRYQKTDATIAGLAAPLVSAAVQPNDPTAYNFSVGTATYTQVDNSYGHVLPSLDLNLMVLPDLKVRLDASRTETQPPNSDLIPNTTYGGRVDALTATGHNPKLLPYLSNNFDLGAEWYYAPNDYLAVDGFLKHVSQFPVEGVKSLATTVIDPSPRSSTYGKPMVFAETTNINGQAANVHGVEVTWQHMLKYGFGFQINGTYAHTNKNFNPHDLEKGATQFALPGVGNSANLIAFYQRHGLQARLAVQWQGSQLLTLGQEQNGGAFGTEPTYLEANTHVDFSSSYDINSHLSVFFEALNLTDQVYHTRGRFKNDTLNLIDYGRSFTMGVRAKL